MVSGYSSPFDELFALQRALEASLASGWLGTGTAGAGSFPPINVFQQGDDLVAVIELPGVDKDSLEIEAKENTIRTPDARRANTMRMQACTGASACLVRSIVR
jgi:HSP20 family protein